jgi:hypothetical protein
VTGKVIVGLNGEAESKTGSSRDGDNRRIPKLISQTIGDAVKQPEKRESNKNAQRTHTKQNKKILLTNKKMKR